MSDLIREIDEEVAKEKSEQFIEKWGLPIGVFIVILLIGLFFYFQWQNGRETSALARADNFAAAAEALENEPETAAALFTDLSTQGSGFAELSEFKLGDALWNQGKHAEAVALWSAYAQDTTNNENFRNLARFKMAWFGNGMLSDEEILNEINILETLPAYKDLTPVLHGLRLIHRGDAEGAKTLLGEASQNEEANDVARNLAQSVLNLANGL